MTDLIKSLEVCTSSDDSGCDNCKYIGKPNCSCRLMRDALGRLKFLEQERESMIKQLRGVYQAVGKGMNWK